jgi:predicted helicase
MSQAKISYFSLSALQGKEAKLDWIAGTSFEAIKFENINPDAKGNWINLTDNDFDSFLPLVDKEVKAGRSDEAVFKLLSNPTDYSESKSPPKTTPKPNSKPIKLTVRSFLMTIRS